MAEQLAELNKGENLDDTYSTSERWTGKYWINGKKIYERVLQGTLSVPTDGVASVTNFGVISSNMDMPVRQYFAIHSVNGEVSTPYFSPDLSRKVLSYVYAKQAYIRSDYGDFNGSSVDVIIEYTKS